MNDAKKEKAVKDIATILNGFTATEINEILFEVNDFCSQNFIFVLNNGEAIANPRRCE